MAKVEEKGKKPEDNGIELTMGDPKPVETKPAETKVEEVKDGEPKTLEGTDRDRTDKVKDDKEVGSKFEGKDTAETLLSDNDKDYKPVEMGPGSDPSVDEFKNDAEFAEYYEPEPYEDNFVKDDMMNLAVYKKKQRTKTSIRDFIANACDVQGYRTEDQEKGKPKKVMSKKRALASVLWMGAKLTVACTVFGPIVGSWLIAHYTTHDKAKKLEDKARPYVHFFDKL